jgi:hypothetical protein
MSDVAPLDPSPAQRQWQIGRRVGEVALIAVGVFLGLAGEQWRDNTERRARAHEALRRIREEIALNQAAVAKVKEYHATTHERLQKFLAMPVAERDKGGFRLDGVMPAQFEQTAWSLAQSMQALADIDSELAFALARIYGVQANYLGLSAGITSAMYLRPPTENAVAFLQSLSIYYSDVVLLEQALEGLYRDITPRLDRALGE